MAIYLDAFRQCFFVPTPTFTEKDLPDQAGRVFIVTGGYSGIGKELTRFLYQKNGTVYVAGRSKSTGEAAIEEIRKDSPSSDGKLVFLHVDLADLSSIKGSAEDFMKREQRLDVLVNNAGVMAPPIGTKSAQGHEVQLGTNVLGPWLFTQLLTPLLRKTAKSSPPGSVRVSWAASLGTMASKTGGVEWEGQGPKLYNDPFGDYAQTKAANVFLARKYQSLHTADGIVSNSFNPGNLRSPLQRHQGWWMNFITPALVHPTHLGGYTELFAGWSKEAAREENRDKYIGPWGRFVMLREDLHDREGDERLWKWCEEECKQYM